MMNPRFAKKPINSLPEGYVDPTWSSQAYGATQDEQLLLNEQLKANSKNMVPRIRRKSANGIGSDVKLLMGKGTSLLAQGRHSQIFVVNNVTNLYQTLASSGGLYSFSGIEPKPGSSFIVKAVTFNSRYRDVDPTKWMDIRLREAKLYQLLYNHSLDLNNKIGSACQPVIPPPFFSGFDQNTSIFFYVMHVPYGEDPKKLVSLQKLVEMRNVTYDAYRSIESAVAKLWFIGAFQADASTLPMVLSRQSGMTYIVDLDTIVSIPQDIKINLYDAWNTLPGTLDAKMDKCKNLVKGSDDNEMHAIPIWNHITGGGVLPRMKVVVYKLYGRQHWYPVTDMLKQLYGMRVPQITTKYTKDTLALKPLGTRLSIPGSISPISLAPRKTFTKFTRPRSRSLAPGSSKGRGWSRRVHGRAWQQPFFRFGDGEGSSSSTTAAAGFQYQPAAVYQSPEAQDEALDENGYYYQQPSEEPIQQAGTLSGSGNSSGSMLSSEIEANAIQNAYQDLSNAKFVKEYYDKLEMKVDDIVKAGNLDEEKLNQLEPELRTRTLAEVRAKVVIGHLITMLQTESIKNVKNANLRRRQLTYSTRDLDEGSMRNYIATYEKATIDSPSLKKIVQGLVADTPSLWVVLDNVLTKDNAVSNVNQKDLVKFTKKAIQHFGIYDVSVIQNELKLSGELDTLCAIVSALLLDILPYLIEPNKLDIDWKDITEALKGKDIRKTANLLQIIVRRVKPMLIAKDSIFYNILKKVKESLKRYNYIDDFNSQRPWYKLPASSVRLNDLD